MQSPSREARESKPRVRTMCTAAPTERPSSPVTAKSAFRPGTNLSLSSKPLQEPGGVRFGCSGRTAPVSGTNRLARPGLHTCWVFPRVALLLAPTCAYHSLPRVRLAKRGRPGSASSIPTCRENEPVTSGRDSPGCEAAGTLWAGPMTACVGLYRDTGGSQRPA